MVDKAGSKRVAGRPAVSLLLRTLRVSRWPRWLVPVSVLFAVATAVGYSYTMAVGVPSVYARIHSHSTVLSQSAGFPLRYRILVPFAAELIAGGLEGFVRFEDAFIWAYALVDTASVCVTLFALYFYLRVWFSSEQALIGALIAGALMPVAFRYHYFHPWSLLEPGLFALGLLSLARGRLRGYLAVLLLATLNRESGMFLALAYPFAVWGGFKRADASGRLTTIARSAGFVAAPLFLYAVLVLTFGYAPNPDVAANTFANNLKPANLATAAFNIAIFLGPFWLFVVLGARRAPAFVKRSAGIVPLYVLALVFTRWLEVRPLMTLYPVLIPMGLSFMYRPLPARAAPPR